MPPILQGINLTKAYGPSDNRVYGLIGGSLELQKGELVAVVGRPGSGMSTLLHVLGCLQRPDNGAVRIEGMDMTQLDDEELVRLRSQKTGFRVSDLQSVA